MNFTLYPPQAIHELGKRENQEDAIYPKPGEATERDRLFILCDGMGGHEKGEVASNTVSKAMAEYFNKNASADEVVSDDVLLATLEYAYQQLDAIDDGAAKKMGTTLCLLLFHRGGLTAMHIGDSRIYHIRPSEHRLLYQSKDHSLVYDLYQAGEITYDEMRTSPQKNIITRAIQSGEDNRVRPSIVHITDIKADDYFYICSDGMLEQMNNEELCDLFSAKGSDEEKRKQLIDATADNKDNHSAYFVHIKDVTKKQGDNLKDDEQTSKDNALNIKPYIGDAEDDVAVVATRNNEVPQTPPQIIQAGGKKSSWQGLLAVLVGLAVVVLLACGIMIIKPSEKKAESQKESPYGGGRGEEDAYHSKQTTITRLGVKAVTTTLPKAENKPASGKAGVVSSQIQFEQSQPEGSAGATQITPTSGKEAETEAGTQRQTIEKLKGHKKGNPSETNDEQQSNDNNDNV